MKTSLISLFAVAAAFFSLTGVSFSQDASWTTDYNKALERAKAENRAILLDFTGSDWCGWCIKMKEESLNKPQFKTYARTNLVLVEVDFPKSKTLPQELKQQNDQLKKKFGVRGYPTFVLVDKDGKELGRQGGYLAGGPAAFIAKLNTFHTPAPKPSSNGGWTSGSSNWGSSWSGTSAFKSAPTLGR